MSPENKQRIVGIVILVAFVALLIPFLFTGGFSKKSNKAEQVAIELETKPLVNQPELATNAMPSTPNMAAEQSATTAPVTTAPVVAESVAAMPNNASPTSSTEKTADVSFPPELTSPDQTAPASLTALPAANNDENMAKEAVAVPPSANKENIAAPVANEEPKPIDVALLGEKAKEEKISTNQPIEHKVKGKNKAKTIAAQVSKKKSGSWAVQVGCFTNSTSVAKLMGKLRSRGFSAYTQKITKDGVAMTKVLVGPELNKQATKALAGKINRELGIQGYSVKV